MRRLINMFMYESDNNEFCVGRTETEKYGVFIRRKRERGRRGVWKRYDAIYDDYDTEEEAQERLDAFADVIGWKFIGEEKIQYICDV